MICRPTFPTAFILAALALLAPASAADISGAWNFKVTSPEGEHQATLTVTQNEEKIAGNFSSARRGEHKVEGTVKGAQVEFTVRYVGPDQTIVVLFQGSLDGDRMSGKFQAGDAGGTWTAEKAK